MPYNVLPHMRLPLLEISPLHRQPTTKMATSFVMLARNA
jgi:hypothetical protein